MKSKPDPAPVTIEAEWDGGLRRPATLAIASRVAMSPRRASACPPAKPERIIPHPSLAHVLWS
ncbi:MAG TPA: hypothetical protein VFV14_07700 [Myxococcaceae bacterium]|nr:hypothetical protein [Myxococcaceae bacterium]